MASYFMQTSTLRKFARNVFPPEIRRPLGSLWGRTYHSLARPILGLIFDLKGGKCHVDGVTIEVPKDITTRAYRSCFLLGDYEAEERALIKKYVKPTDSVIELGACMGLVSCVTNSLLADKTRHLVVEGNPKLMPVIERNKAINGAGFTALNRAISQEDEVTFYLHPEYIVGGTSQRKSRLPVVVKGASLDHLHQEYGPFDTMIMDIEGSEAEAIPPAVELLKSYRLVILETHDWAVGAEATQKCRETLKTAGLRHIDTVDATEAWSRDS